MDEHSFLEKAYQFLMIMVGGLVSFFFYRQKKLNDQIDSLDRRVDKIEISQAGYNKSVEFLIKKFDKMESNIEKMLDERNRK